MSVQPDHLRSRSWLARQSCAAAGMLAVTAVASLAAAAEAHATCTSAASRDWYTGSGCVPVRYANNASGAPYEVGLHRLGVANAPEYLRVAVELINASSHGGRRLCAPTPAPDITIQPDSNNGSWQSALPNGIYVYAFPSNVPALCSGNHAVENAVGKWTDLTPVSQKSAIWLRSGGQYACTQAFGSILPDMRWWVQPQDSAPTAAYDSESDLLGVMVHELLHAQGLLHRDVPQLCDEGLQDDEDPMAQVPYNVASVMTANSTSARRFRRRLRRDDVEGMRVLHGTADRSIYAFERHGSSGSGGTQTWGLVTPVATQTPPRVSSGARAGDDSLLVSFTNSLDQVRWVLGTWGTNTWQIGSLGNGYSAGDASAARTWDSVAVAAGKRSNGDQRRVVAWIGGDDVGAGASDEDAIVPPTGGFLANVNLRLRWRVWDGTAWRALRYTSTTKYKDLGVGYAPKEDKVVLVGLDTCAPTGEDDGCDETVADSPEHQRVWIRTVSALADTGGTCTTAYDLGPVLMVGSPICDDRLLNTACLLPVVTSADTGPRLKYWHGTIGLYAPWGLTCFLLQDFPTTGVTTSLFQAMIPSLANNGAAVDTTTTHAAWLREVGTTSARRLDRSSGWWTNANGVSPPPSVFGQSATVIDWPTQTGAMTKTSTAEVIRWRTVEARRP